MSSEAVSTCGVFPLFARVSGKFWKQGGGFFGFFAQNRAIGALGQGGSLFYNLATSNSQSFDPLSFNSGRFRQIINAGVVIPYTDSPALIFATLPVHKLFGHSPHMAMSLCVSDIGSLNTAWQANPNREQWGAGDYTSKLVDPLNDQYPVRQVGWTSGIYTHSINSVIRRRTGPALADCTYWQALQLTDNHILAPGGSPFSGPWTIHNQGEDPAGPWNIPVGVNHQPAYWANNGADNQAGNSFLIGEFFDDERNAVSDDWKYDFATRGFYRVTSDYMQMPQLRTALTTLTGPNGNRVLTLIPDDPESTGSPKPEWMRAIHAATYAGGVWTIGNAFGYAPAKPFTDTLFVPRGWIAIKGTRYYRILMPMLINELDEYPDPDTAPTQFERLQNRQAWTDSNYPSSYSNFATLRQDFFHAETRRKFTKKRRASECVIRTQFVDMRSTNFTSSVAVNLGPSSVNTNKTETLPSGAVIDVREITQTISLNCGTKKVRNDTEQVFADDMTEHPLLEPTANNATSGGRIAKCRYYTVAPNSAGPGGGIHFRTAFFPYPENTGPRFGELEWIDVGSGALTTAPYFIQAGECIEVEFWAWNWHTGNNPSLLYTSAARTTLFPNADYTRYVIARYYARSAQFFPTPFCLTPLLSKDITAAGANLAWALDGSSWPQAVSRDNSGQALTNGYYAEVRDTRSLADVSANIYPNLPSGGWFNVKSTPREQEVHFQTGGLRWGDARWFEFDTDFLAADWLALSPLVLIRQKLELSGGCCGDCD